MKTFRNTVWFWVLLLIIAAFLFGYLKRWTKPHQVLAERKDELEMLLDKLAMCESSNKEGFRKVDSNGYYSYATFQFQKGTFEFFAKKFDLFDSDLNKLIYTSDAQRKVARTMLQDNPKNWSHWYICGKLIGLDKWAVKQAKLYLPKYMAKTS